MTTEELAELFLVRLYDLAEAAPHPNFLFTVNDFAPMLPPSDRKRLQGAIDILGDRGLVITAAMDMMGGISAAITMDGSVYVEKGGETGIIERYRQDPGAFVRAMPEGSAGTQELVPEPPLSGFTPARAIEAIIADMEEAVGSDRASDAGQRQDAYADIATLRIQLGRGAKNVGVIAAMLEGLSRIGPVAPLAAALRCIVEGYVGRG